MVDSRDAQHGAATHPDSACRLNERCRSRVRPFRLLRGRRRRRFLYLIVCVLFGSVAVAAGASADGRYSRFVQTDGGFADGFYLRWTHRSGIIAPANGFALYHMYFTIAQPFANNNTDLINSSTSFEEVGVNVGSLNFSQTNNAQFYWATCVNPTYPALCLSFGPGEYFEGPMDPAPTLVAGHLYDFYAVGQTHNGSDYWWDLYIRDESINSIWHRGGGRAFGSTTVGCCSTAVSWGGEASGEGAYTSLPPTNADVLLYKPAGSPNYSVWGPSVHYPPGGSGACQVDDATGDTTRPGCGGDPNAAGKSAGYWNSKYNNWTYYQTR